MTANRTSLQELLCDDMRAREALDPQYFRAVKQDSIDCALAMGIAPEIVAHLYAGPLEQCTAK